MEFCHGGLGGGNLILPHWVGKDRQLPDCKRFIDVDHAIDPRRSSALRISVRTNNVRDLGLLPLENRSPSMPNTAVRQTFETLKLASTLRILLDVMRSTNT